MQTSNVVNLSVGDRVKVMQNSDTSSRGLQCRYGYIVAIDPGDDPLRNARVEFNDFCADLRLDYLEIQKPQVIEPRG